MMEPTIYQYIKGQEADFISEEIQVGDNWTFNFRNHVQMIFHLKNGMFFTGSNSWTTQMRAFKNIMEPILNLAYWSEDIEVKDVVFYIEEQYGKALSFLIKKYHDEIYAKQHNLDELFDEITESDLDYGGALVQKSKNGAEVLQLTKIAFCDQTDILGGPIGFKFFFSPDKLRSMEKQGWGKESNGATVSIEDLIVLADDEKPSDSISKQDNKVTGKSIEVYIVHGALPEAYLKDNDNFSKWYGQVHIVAFYTTSNGKQQGVTLYRKTETDDSLMFQTTKKIPGRALGRGQGEMLLHPQVWTNFLEIHKTKMLEAGAKSPLWTDDENFENENQIQEQDNLVVNKVAKGTRIGLIPTIDQNKVVIYENSINSWYEHAQLEGSAFDPIMGKQPVSGTTFRGQERNVAQGRGLHDRRRGQRAKFIEELYRKVFIPDMVKELINGKKFLATLTQKEMEWVAENLSEATANRQQIDQLLSGTIPEDIALLKSQIKTNFYKQGNKQLFEVLKGELDGIELKIGIDVAGKQKDLAGMTDKILSIFQFVFANPQGFQQAMQIPGMSNAFDDILEFSGISPADFSSMTTPMPSPLQPQQPQATQQSPVAQLQQQYAQQNTAS